VFDKKVKFRGSGRREENLLAKIALITEEYISNIIITDGNDGRTAKS
jgi:hypothetical protein